MGMEGHGTGDGDGDDDADDGLWVGTAHFSITTYIILLNHDVGIGTRPVQSREPRIRTGGPVRNSGSSACMNALHSHPQNKGGRKGIRNWLKIFSRIGHKKRIKKERKGERKKDQPNRSLAMALNMSIVCLSLSSMACRFSSPPEDDAPGAAPRRAAARARAASRAAIL